jgi:hypothetical protein
MVNIRLIAQNCSKHFIWSGNVLSKLVHGYSFGAWMLIGKEKEMLANMLLLFLANEVSWH